MTILSVSGFKSCRIVIPKVVSCKSGAPLISLPFIEKYIQWNLDPLFFKGMEKTNDECGKTINTGNYFKV
jgi:hypothetical protein